MKKLKIFLLLSILLCFGFALRPEVHAQGGGPEIFEGGDVLPATTQLKISWDNTFDFTDYDSLSAVYIGVTTIVIEVGYDEDFDMYIFNIFLPSPSDTIDIVYDSVWQSPYSEYGSSGQSYVIIDISNLTEAQRTIHQDSHTITGLYWEDIAPAPTGYTITFNSNGGTTISDMEDATELPNPLPTTTKSGYTFAGWYYDDDFTTQAYAGDELEDDVTLYAKWILNTYTITYNSNGGSSVPQTSNATQLPNPLPTPTKEGYIFVGWYYDSDFFDEDKAFAGDPLTDDVTLYARWLPGKLFEKDEVLPATTQLKIHILFGQGDYHVETVDRSGIYLSIDWTDGVEDYLDMHVEFGGLVRYDGEVTASAIYYTIDISNWTSSQRTIKSVLSENGNFVTWEDANPDGYTQGYLTAREEFGYYDSRTNQWLSVSEYLDLYGTDKPGQSDFYGNFDKYFIPAMIIVFGGAIVLTVLKVFKGRE